MSVVSRKPEQTSRKPQRTIRKLNQNPQKMVQSRQKHRQTHIKEAQVWPNVQKCLKCFKVFKGYVPAEPKQRQIRLSKVKVNKYYYNDMTQTSKTNLPEQVKLLGQVGTGINPNP